MTQSDPYGPGGEASADQEGMGEDVCDACSGSGNIDGQQCQVCGGTGKVVEPVSGA